MMCMFIAYRKQKYKNEQIRKKIKEKQERVEIAIEKQGKQAKRFFKVM